MALDELEAQDTLRRTSWLVRRTAGSLLILLLGIMGSFWIGYQAFLSVAIENGCIGSTFAEDDERIIVYTMWSDETTLENFRSSEEYHSHEGNIIQSFVAAGFEIPDDILFNSTATILFSN
tara:strand:- start:232 stop:594 length:363 start_codon:yes stop_codon:yes gene_type:complete